MVATKIPRRKFALSVAIAALLLEPGCTPPGPAALLKGEKLLREGEFAAAISKLEFAKDSMPREPRAWNLLGLAYHHAGKPQLAMSAYRQALVFDRSNTVAIAHYNLGCLMLEQNSPVAAADELRSYALITNSVPGFLKLGTAQLWLRRFQDAENSFEAARRLDAKNAEALNGLGVVHAQRGQRDAAPFFAAALQAHPKYSPALLNSAVLAHQNPATKAGALQRYREYLAAQKSGPYVEPVKLLVRQLEIELTPAPTPPPVVSTSRTNPPVWTNSVALTTNKNAAAKSNALTVVVKTNQVAATTNKPSPPAQVPVMVVAITNAVPPKAAVADPIVSRPVPLSVVTSPPPSVVILPASESSPELGRPASGANEKKPGFFARLNPFRDKPKSATNETSRKIVLNSGSASVDSIESAGTPVFPRYTYAVPVRPPVGNRLSADRAMQQAMTAQRNGRTNEAASAYQTAIASDPSYFNAQYNAAVFALQSGDLKRALAGSETALALEPDSINARYIFALALKQTSYPHDAANELERIIEAKPDDTRAHLALGNLYAQQLADTTKARAHYKKFLELDPRSPQASAVRFWLAANP